MAKRIPVSQNNRRFGHYEWPEADDAPEVLFKKRAPLRLLKIMVDADLIDVAVGLKVPTSAYILKEFLNHKLVQTYRYLDDGPPTSVEAMKIPGPPRAYLRAPVYAGWVTIYDHSHGYWHVTYSTKEGHITHSAVGESWPRFAKEHATSAVEVRINPESREKDVLALCIADEALTADIYVTEREYLHTPGRWNQKEGIAVCSVDEAVELIGLYLRTQQEFVIPRADPHIGFSIGSGLFFWIGARELLPEAWRWFHACVYHSTTSGDEKLLSLGGSVLERMTRVLVERDRLYVGLNQGKSADSSDNVLAALDNILMVLMGAVDASARVAHVVLGLSGSEKYAGWQSDSWLKKVAMHAPDLAAVFDAKNSRAWYGLTVLRLLRNSIHGAALKGVNFYKDGKHEDFLLGIPKDDEVEILAAMAALGGTDKWGIRQIVPGRSEIDPAVLADELLKVIIELLNGVMRLTPVESLGGVVIKKRNTLPPIDRKGMGPHSTFSEWNRVSIRRQLGL